VRTAALGCPPERSSVIGRLGMFFLKVNPYQRSALRQLIPASVLAPPPSPGNPILFLVSERSLYYTGRGLSRKTNVNQNLQNPLTFRPNLHNSTSFSWTSRRNERTYCSGDSIFFFLVISVTSINSHLTPSHWPARPSVLSIRADRRRRRICRMTQG